MKGTAHIAPIFPEPAQSSGSIWQRELREYSQCQIALTNLTTSEQVVRLWGGNQGLQLGEPLQTVDTGVYPQAIIRNPFNGLFYVANQLGNTITVFDEDGASIATIDLGSNIPGAVSPVAMAVNESNGDVFIAGTIADRVYTITAGFQIGMEVDTDSRPIALAYNPINGLLYALHLVGQKITVINPATGQITTTLNTGALPTDLCVDPASGHVCVVNSGDDSVTVFDHQHNIVTSIPNVGQTPVACVFSESTDQLLVVARVSEEVFAIDISTQTIVDTVSIPGEPDLIALAGDPGGFIVGDAANSRITWVNVDLSPKLSLDVQGLSRGLVFQPTTQAILITQPLENRVSILYLGEDQGHSVAVSENYKNVAMNFQYNPALLKHVKGVFSGNTTAPVIKIGQRTPSGREQSWCLSLTKFRSPQHRMTILEMYDLENEVIDGKTFWVITLLPNERITLVLYYEQQDRSRIEKKDLWDDKREKDEYEERTGALRTTPIWDRR